jgi:hypothetical protein
LHIGVRPGGPAFEAHAWVQVGEDVLNDDPAVTETYLPLPLDRATSRHLVFR